MYGGHIQEVGEVHELFEKPLHPYTEGLLNSLPRPDQDRVDRLKTIKGMVPAMLDMPVGCRFCTRCDKVMSHCESVVPEIYEVGDRQVRCHLYSDDPKLNGGTK